MTLEEQKEALVHKSFVLMFRILLIFGIPAAAAFFIGRWLDTTYDMRPYGSMAVLAVAFILSWTLVIRMYKSMTKAFADLAQKEEAQKQEAQATIQKNLQQ